MAANKEIHEFAIRWFEKYRNCGNKKKTMCSLHLSIARLSVTIMKKCCQL